MIASVVALFGFVHVADLFDKLPHTFDHMGRVYDFRPSAEAANPGVEHVADFYVCLGGEVGVIYLFILHTRNAELVNHGVQALVNESDGHTLTLAAEHGEDSLGVVVHIHIFLELLLPFPCCQEFLYFLHAVDAVDNGFHAVVGQQIEETVVNQHLVRIHNVELAGAPLHLCPHVVKGVGQVYNVIETGKLLGIGKAKVYELIKHGYLPALDLGGLKISDAAIDAFIANYTGYNFKDMQSPSRLVMG